MPVVDIFIRENITYQASTALLVRAGSDLGSTMHGHHDFQLGDDPLHKVHVGHYTFYSKAIVKNSKYLIRAPGVFVRKYLRGENESNMKFLHRIPAAKNVSLKDVMHYAELKGGELPPDEDGNEGGHLVRIGNFSTIGTEKKYFIHGTSYYKDNTGKVTERHINTLGFGEHTYPGCKAGREGRGIALEPVSRTIASMI